MGYQKVGLWGSYLQPSQDALLSECCYSIVEATFDPKQNIWGH